MTIEETKIKIINSKMNQNEKNYLMKILEDIEKEDSRLKARLKSIDKVIR